MRRRSRVLRAVLGGLFALTLLFTVEAGLRLAGVGPAYRPEDLGQWRVSGGMEGREMRGPRDGHGFRVTTNADGLRTGAAREKSRHRVMLLGDSTVFGWGVDEGGTIADAAQAERPDLEILNAGQPGYSTTMAAWLYGEVLHAYEPDVTVMFVPMHDTNRVLVSDRELLEGGATAGARLRVLLARESRIYAALRTQLVDTRPWLLPDQASAEPRVPRVSDAERTLAMDTIRASGTRLALGYLPFAADVGGVAQAERPTEAWLRDYVARHGLDFVDLRRCCRGGGLVLDDDIGHLSAAGNRAVGQALASALE